MLLSFLVFRFFAIFLCGLQVWPKFYSVLGFLGPPDIPQWYVRNVSFQMRLNDERHLKLQNESLSYWWITVHIKANILSPNQCDVQTFSTSPKSTWILVLSETRGVRQKFAEGMLIWWVPKSSICKFFQWSCKFFPWCVKENFWSFLEKVPQKWIVFHNFTLF